jgi:hypothetical protein
MRVYDVSEKLERALAGDATAAADLWRAIAQGEASDADTLVWARNVAKHLVLKVLDSDLEANRRREAAYPAVGLEGRIDHRRELRELAQELADTPDTEAVRIARLLCDDFDTVDDRTAVKRWRRLKGKQ